jgi:phage shock protein PspC (stress-responsive transcriptional regulator)
MKKIININLYGRVIPIEDAAYDSLQRYIESLRRYFVTEEGRDEIINDIESRISELMNDKIKKGAPCITEADIEEIITAMGRVEDFEAADRSENMSTTESSSNTSGASSASYQQTKRGRFTGRLYRDANDKILGGVCSGIAAYLNVDPTVVRLIFAIITFGGFGLGFLLYILLWIILPVGNIEGYSGKRFFRNPDDQILGGVCGGLAAYFNKSSTTIRLIFAAPILLNIIISVLNGIFNIGNFDFGVVDIAFGSLTSTFIIAYIILWIVLPLAKSPYDKMEMRGERVDVNRIKQNVQEGMGDFKTRAKDWGEEVKTAAQNLSNRASDFAGTKGRAFAQDATSVMRPVGSGIGHAIGVLFKSFFLFVAGVSAFFLFVVVLMFTFGGVARPINTFLLDGFWQKASMWGVVIFFLAVPLIAIITWIVRRIMKVRSQNRYLGWTFGGLWTIGWICLPLFISSMVKDFSFMERTETPVAITQPGMSKLVVQVPENAIRYNGNFSWLNLDDDEGWDISDDSLKLSNIRINVKQSEDSLYHVTLFKYSAGDNRNKALQRAENISFKVTNVDSILQLGSGFGISEADKFRGQKVMVEIKVPVGKQIRFHHTVGEKLNPYNIRVGETERYGRKRNWGRRDYEFEWDNNNFYDWEPDTDYYMTTEGKLKQVGVPENEKPATTDSLKKDSLLKDYQRKLDSVEATGSEDADMQPEEITAKKKEIDGRLATPMPIPFIPTIF